MSTKFQQLFLQLMEDNSAAPGGVFGSNDAYASPENLDTKFSMAITGKSSVKGPKNKKKKKFPLIRRNLNRSL
jgi:hypothetical protein